VLDREALDKKSGSPFLTRRIVAIWTAGHFQSGHPTWPKPDRYTAAVIVLDMVGSDQQFYFERIRILICLPSCGTSPPAWVTRISSFRRSSGPSLTTIHRCCACLPAADVIDFDYPAAHLR